MKQSYRSGRKAWYPVNVGWPPAETRTAVRWLVFLLVPLSLWPILAWLHGAPRVDGALALRDARFVAGSTAEPPAADVAGEMRTLPDDWRRERRGVLAGWYELRFRVEQPNADEWAIYLPILSMNAAVYLDRELVGDGGRFDEPVARNWSRPLLWPLAGAVLAPGEHVLHVRLQADLPDSGLLDRVYVGPLDVLAPAYARRDALKTEAVWVITLCLVIVGVFTGALWLQWRDPSYGWFAAAAFAWAAVHSNLLVVDIPVGTVTWWGCWYLALIAWVVALARFLLAFVGADDPRPVCGLTTLGLAGVTVLVPLTVWQSPWLHPAARVWITASLPVLGFAVVQTMQWLREQGDDPGAAVPSVLGLSVVGCAVHDWLIFLGLAGPTYDYFLPYAAPPVFVAMGWVLLQRFTGALEESAALVADLERRVEAKRDELQRSYERLHDVERARVLAEERERIMREMHDGLGSHLVSTLALLENDGLARDAVGRAVRAALDDLRLMIDALVPLDGDLLGALAMLRARMQPRLEAAGIRVEWRVSDLPRIADLGAPQVLQVLRILQEAMTNVLKHAGARTITVRTSVADGGDPGVMVELADDGRGLGGTTLGGRGLENMRQRAAAIGATLAIEDVPPGTRVRLHIPIAERAVA